MIKVSAVNRRETFFFLPPRERITPISLIRSIFDREQIKNIANYYAITSYYPMMSMAPSETEQYMSEEGLAYLEENFTFSYNQQRATELLEQEGWVKTAISGIGTDSP